MQGLLIRRERIAQNMSQQALCQGICTPSYLSKIEGGQARCSDEMYALLFDALGIHYETDAHLLAEFDTAFDAFYALRARDGRPSQQEGAALLSLCLRLRYSPRGVDAALAMCLLRDAPAAQEDIDGLAAYAPAFGRRQRLLFTLARVAHLRAHRRYGEAIACLEAVKAAEEPVVYLCLCYNHFAMGAYALACESGEEAYRLFAARGDVEPMLDVAMLVAGAYANAMDYARMCRWHAVSRSINRAVGSERAACLQCYNEGASLLMYGRHEEGLRCLLAGEPLAARLYADDRRQADLYHQKLAFAWIFTGAPERAARSLAAIEAETAEPSVQASVALMRYMLQAPDYARRKEYCEHLERCLAAAEGETRGRLEFFGCFLLGAYKATRQYKRLCV